MRPEPEAKADPKPDPEPDPEPVPEQVAAGCGRGIRLLTRGTRHRLRTATRTRKTELPF